MVPFHQGRHGVHVGLGVINMVAGSDEHGVIYTFSKLYLRISYITLSSDHLLLHISVNCVRWFFAVPFQYTFIMGRGGYNTPIGKADETSRGTK